MKKLTQKYSKRKYKNIFIGQGATPGCNRLPVKIRKNLPSEYGYLSEGMRQTGRYIEHLPGRIGNTYIRSQGAKPWSKRSQGAKPGSKRKMHRHLSCRQEMRKAKEQKEKPGCKRKTNAKVQKRKRNAKVQKEEARGQYK